MWSTKRTKSQKKKSKLVQNKSKQHNPVDQEDETISNIKYYDHATNKQQQEIEIPKYLKEYIILSIEKWLPSLESKYVLSQVVSNIDYFDINDEKSKIKVLDSIISTLTQKLSLFIDTDNEPKNYSLLNKYNKQLLINGYLNMYSPSYVPNVLLILIYEYYDYSLIWDLTEQQMRQFKNATFQHVIYGPKMRINDILFELTLCPMGWQTDFEGFVDCFFEITKPDHIKSVTCLITQYFHEFGIKKKSVRKMIKPNGGYGMVGSNFD